MISALISAPAEASPLTFTIDSAQSHMSFAIETTGGTQVSSAQTPGSDSTSLSGTVKIDLTATTIQFLTTADTQFALRPLAQAPQPGGAPGTAPAQYGLNLSIPGVGGGVIAARNYLGDVTSPPIPLAGTTFDASQVTSNLVVGNTAYNLVVFGSPVVGSFDTNFPALNMLTAGSLAFAAGTYTLTLPILVKGPVSLAGFTVNDVYAGELVATATVPEPTSILLLALGACSSLLFHRFGRRRSCE
jgi:hypothetical protein